MSCSCRDDIFYFTGSYDEGARASARPARTRPDKTELQTSSESVGHEIKSSMSVIVGRLQLRSFRANESAAVGHHLVTYRFESERVPCAGGKGFFVVVECASRGRVRTRTCRKHATGPKAQDQRIPAAAMLCTYNCSCTVDHNAAVGNDPVTCGFESGASHAGRKKVLLSSSSACDVRDASDQRTWCSQTAPNPGHRINAFLQRPCSQLTTQPHCGAQRSMGNDPVTCGYESGASLAGRSLTFSAFALGSRSDALRPSRRVRRAILARDPRGGVHHRPSIALVPARVGVDGGDAGRSSSSSSSATRARAGPGGLPRRRSRTRRRRGARTASPRFAAPPPRGSWRRERVRELRGPDCRGTRSRSGRACRWWPRAAPPAASPPRPGRCASPASVALSRDSGSRRMGGSRRRGGRACG